MAKSGFNFNVKVKMNKTSKIIKDHGLNKDGKVVRYLRDTSDRLMMPFIPRWFWWNASKAKNISE